MSQLIDKTQTMGLEPKSTKLKDSHSADQARRAVLPVMPDGVPGEQLPPKHAPWEARSPDLEVNSLTL